MKDIDLMNKYFINIFFILILINLIFYKPQLDKLTKNHKNMENLVQILISQNCKQQIENKALWEEIQKSKFKQKI